jgi:peptidoglycan hydrolase-like protein with peptidoglycan-binding domain
MLFASKIVYSGIVFLLLTPWISGPRSTPPAKAPDLIMEMHAASHSDDINKVQQTLLDKGHYRGKIDGVVGLRTRASIRAYQKAENLPVTGQLDHQTAGKLGVTPETDDENGNETMQGKPSAGIKRATRSGQSGKTGPNAIKTDSHPESDL